MTKDLFWHYTTGLKFRYIVADGAIKAATAYIDPGEKPIVWFSANQFWEETACKLAPDGSQRRLNMLETYECWGGLVRFGVAEKTAPLDWHAIKELSGMSSRTAQVLYRGAIDQGARPGQWRGTFGARPSVGMGSRRGILGRLMGVSPS